MDFRILGRFEVLDRERELALGGFKQRAVLAILLLHRRDVVSIDCVVDELWGERPPATAAQTVRVYVSRLRKALGDGVLETHGRGYRLAVDPAQIDAERFEAFIADGRSALRSGEADRAAELLSAGLELWRGRPLEEFLYEPFAQPEIARLEEARLAALEDRIDAQLRMGGGGELVPELARLVDEQPLRERLIASLMLSLYRAGRQTDALDAFQAARRRLLGELGLEPGPELRELQQRILEHDTTLGAPRRLAPLAGRRRSRSLSVVALAVLAAIVAGAFVLSAGAVARRPSLAQGASGVVAVYAASDRLASATPLPEAPGSVEDGDGAVWVASPGAQQVAVIDPSSGAVLDPHIAVSGSPASIVSGGGAIWVASSVGATVTRIDPGTESVTQTVTLPGANLDAIAYGAGGVWAADPIERQLFEISPITGALERTLLLDLQPSAVAIRDGALWVAGYSNATVEELDPASGRVLARVRVGDGPAALAFQAGSLWVANSLDSTVSRIHPATPTVTATIPVGSGPTALAAGSGSVWVANQYSGTVSRIDPRRDRVVANIGVGGAPASLTISGGRLWAGVGANGGSHRGGTLVIVAPGQLTSSNPMTLASVDPAFYNSAAPPQFAGLAYDSLVTFQQSPGNDGLRLVPDLALSIPMPSDDGATYAFRIRPGIRYSNGQLLRAADFRRAFERLFRVGSPGASLYEDIVGAGACVRRPRTCNLSQGIATSDTTGAVTFHLSAPDPDFLLNLSELAFPAPIPPGTPDHETGQHTVPGTGPYEIVSVTANEIRFVRNPFFREWSHAAQPEGNPDAIVWQAVPSAQAAVKAIEQGRADWLSGQIPAAQYRQLELGDPAQLHSNPEFAVEFVPLNTHLAPFNDVRVRQALNYAINRATIAQLNGGSSFATPTCQLIAPGLPGYGRYCPYTLNPSADGVWSAPDMQRARQLVAQSGTRGERVDVWGEPDEGYVPPTTPAYVAGVLRALGYRVHLHLVPFATVTEAMRKRFQLSVDGDWIAAYPYPSSYVPGFVSCGGGTSNGYYCNPSIDREMQRAGMDELSDPRKASALWASIDRQLTNAAVWVPTVTQRDVEITSSRLRNYQYNPVWGFLADQVWLK